MKKSELRQMIKEVLREELASNSKANQNKPLDESTMRSFAVAKVRRPQADRDHFYFDDGGDIYYAGPLRFLTDGLDLFHTLSDAEIFASKVLEDNYFDEAYIIDITDPKAFKYIKTIKN